MKNKEETVKELIEKDRRYIAAIKPEDRRPLIVEEGEGIIVKDIFGDEYIDTTAGIAVNALGHSDPDIIRALAIQSRRILHIYPFGNFITKAQVEFAELLAKITPTGLSKTFFVNSGAEAVDGALKLACKYTGRSEIIACEGAYHGRTLGATSVSWGEIYHKPFEHLLPKCKFVPFGDVTALENSITKKTAAFIIEPIQAEGGVRIPPDDYLSVVREICEKNGTLLIFDEIQTGFGRTGKMFACEHWQVSPDIMTLAKAITCGAVPMGAFISRPEIMDTFRSPPFSHCTTYGGHSLACFVAKIAIEKIMAEKLPEKVLKTGAYFKRQLLELQAEHSDIIKGVRGVGLLLGLELCNVQVTTAFVNGCFKEKVIVTTGINAENVVKLTPPLIITEKQIDEVITRFRKVLETITF